MAHTALDVYLNDHLAGATMGCDLAEHLQSQATGTPLEEVMATLAPEIRRDRQTLIELMERVGTVKSPLKQATAWLTEKAGRPKFSGITSGDKELGIFLSLESLLLGVTGKACLWQELKEVAATHPSLKSVRLDELINRAHAQRTVLEREHLLAGKLALR